MAIQKLMLSAVVATAVAAPLQAGAQWRTALEPAVRHVSMSEYNESGEQIVREKGWLPGIGARLEYHQQAFEVFGAASVFSADINYDGRLQNGRHHSTETGTRLSQIQAGIRYWFRMTTSAIAALEYDAWERNIKGSGTVIGLRERARSMRLLTGLEQVWYVPAVGTFSAVATLVRAEAERLDIRFSGALDDATLRTRPATGYAIELKYQPTATSSLLLGARFDAMKVPRSRSYPVTRNGIHSGEITQPEHMRQSVTLLVRYLF